MQYIISPLILLAKEGCFESLHLHFEWYQALKMQLNSTFTYGIPSYFACSNCITTCIRATCTLDKKNNPWITQAATCIRCKLDHSYERGLYKMQNACLNGICLIFVLVVTAMVEMRELSLDCGKTLCNGSLCLTYVSCKQTAISFIWVVLILI